MIQLSARQKKLLFLVFAGGISLALQIIGGYQLLEFTDSTAFCGTLCHKVMYPEYTTYQASPHSRVLCSDCHVGPGASYLVKSKVSGIPQIFHSIFGTYPRPIGTPVENLRPARETCERCHWPDKFSGDMVRTHTSFTADEANTPKTITRVLKVGGGQSSIARDIHWHIAANVWYLPTDEKRQEIVWVGVENAGGKLTEFVDPKKAGEASPERIREEKRLMDCIDCHNRATHIFYSPDELIDTAMLEGRIDKSLPYIRREAGKALNPASPSLEQAYARVDAIKEFYRTSYPKIYTEKKSAIDSTVSEFRQIARLTTFTDMKVDWNTHIDNSGHVKSPGCYRCHGKLVATSGTKSGKTIDATCESCHYSLTMEQVVGSTIPHSLAGREACTACHGKGAIKPYPSDHAGRPDSACVTCHQTKT